MAVRPELVEGRTGFNKLSLNVSEASRIDIKMTTAIGRSRWAFPTQYLAFG
jgi:hypothetical protein